MGRVVILCVRFSFSLLKLGTELHDDVDPNFATPVPDEVPCGLYIFWPLASGYIMNFYVPTVASTAVPPGQTIDVRRGVNRQYPRNGWRDSNQAQLNNGGTVNSVYGLGEREHPTGQAINAGYPSYYLRPVSG